MPQHILKIKRRFLAPCHTFSIFFPNNGALLFQKRQVSSTLHEGLLEFCSSLQKDNDHPHPSHSLQQQKPYWLENTFIFYKYGETLLVLWRTKFHFYLYYFSNFTLKINITNTSLEYQNNPFIIQNKYHVYTCFFISKLLCTYFH